MSSSISAGRQQSDQLYRHIDPPLRLSNEAPFPPQGLIYPPNMYSASVSQQNDGVPSLHVQQYPNQRKPHLAPRPQLNNVATLPQPVQYHNPQAPFLAPASQRNVVTHPPHHTRYLNHMPQDPYHALPPEQNRLTSSYMQNPVPHLPQQNHVAPLPPQNHVAPLPPQKPGAHLR